MPSTPENQPLISDEGLLYLGGGFLFILILLGIVVTQAHKWGVYAGRGHGWEDGERDG